MYIGAVLEVVPPVKELTALNCAHLQDSWQELPYIFNGQKRIKVWCWEDVAVVHYVDAKPWHADHAEHAAFQVNWHPQLLVTCSFDWVPHTAIY